MNSPEPPGAAAPSGDAVQARVLVARCENFIDDVDFGGAPCLGRIRFRWGQVQAACDTCGGYCGVAVAAWERVELAGAFPDTGQREALATVRAIWGQGAPDAKAALREQPPRWPELCAALDVLAGAVPDTGQAREMSVGERVARLSAEVHQERADQFAIGLMAFADDMHTMAGQWPDDAAARNAYEVAEQRARDLITSDRALENGPRPEPSGDTVPAPDVAALPPEVVAVIEAARAWAANNHRAGHTPTGPSARLYDAICALLGPARALLGTDTTTEETAR